MKRMEQILPTLLDLQRFVGNTRLDAMLRDAEDDCVVALSEEELGYVNAAGDADVLRRQLEDKK